MPHPHLDDETLARLRKQLMRKGRAIANKLADLKANKDVRLIELANVRAAGPRQTPEERLRAYLDLIQSHREAIDSGDGTYGHCRDCGDFLGVYTLNDVPWATLCNACIRKPRHSGG